MPSPLRISILDQSPIAEGSSGAQALRNTIDLAQLADALGYHRYWVAEHHGGPMLAGPSPEALIGPIAAATSGLRVGSGGVMLPHYSPLKVAETFSLLAGLFPGRIDLGLGRAPGTDQLTMFALQRDRRQASPDDFPNQLAELLGYLNDSLPADHPFARLAKTLPGRPERPEAWLLGSSQQSAIWAGELGLPYAFADFINSDGVEIAALYRERFTPADGAAGDMIAVDGAAVDGAAVDGAAVDGAAGDGAAVDGAAGDGAAGDGAAADRAGAESAPRVAVAAWAICAETEEQARHLASSSRMAFTLLRRGQLIAVPPPEKAERFLESERVKGVPAARRRLILGPPELVREQLEALARDYGAEELIVVNITYDHDARRRSYELLAEAFELTPREGTAREGAAREGAAREGAAHEATAQGAASQRAAAATLD